LIRAEYCLERIACQVVRQWRASSRVLDLQHAVLSMSQRRFKAVLATDSFAFPLGNLGESTLAHFLKLSEHVRKQLVLLFLRESRPSFALNLWHSVASPLHSIDTQGA
jgi:hypothetical protein